MKALLISSHHSDADLLLKAMHAQGLDVEVLPPRDVMTSHAGRYSLFVLFPDLIAQDQLDAMTEACRRLRESSNRVPLFLAVVHDAAQLNTLVEAGADDFLHWPADAETLRRRFEICVFRLQKRERDAIRSQHLLEALRDAKLSEQRFRRLAESSTEILTRCSPGGIRLYVSPVCRSILGYDPDELLGMSIFDIVHPADASVLMEVLAQIEHGTEVASAVVRHQRIHGDFVWLEMTCRPVRDRETGLLAEFITVSRDITALVHVEHDKLEAEGQFEAFALRAPVGIFKIDNEGNCVFINPRACEILGMTAARARGQGWLEIVDIRELAAMVEGSIEKAGDEKTYEWEMGIRRSDNQKIQLAIKATTTRDRTGQGTGYLATILDITGEQRARHELEASENRFHSIVERINDLVCRYLPDGTLTYVNEAYCRAFETTSEQLVGTSFLPLIPPEDRMVFERMLSTLSLSNPVATSVHRVLTARGEVRWQEWYDRGSFDDDGRLVEIVATARDITERRTFEQQLADAGQFLRDVLDAVPDPISVEGEDGQFVMVNRAFAELVGRPRETLLGSPAASIRSGARAANAGRWPEVSDEHEISWVTSQGQIRSLFEKRAVLVDRPGQRVLVSVMRDVTERKRYEAQLALTERLASLGTLAAGIAHEVNNPLSYVLGNIVFALDNLNPERSSNIQLAPAEEVYKALAEAREGAQRIAGIVRDVKVFSRADRETLKLVEPVAVVAASLRMVKSNLERRATLVREIHDVSPVLANEGRLAQVMVNLLMNALQAFPERPAVENQIVVSVRPEGRMVILEVRDNGRGIDEENLRHVFDPFFTTKPVGEGMGLGLSICNSIVIAHGGRIDVDSELGRGSSFRVVIPEAEMPRLTLPARPREEAR